MAIHDPMGARPYVTRWISASNTYTIVGMSDNAPEAHPIVSATPVGTFRQSFTGLCGTEVMIRAYDQSTETWSNWIDVTSPCANG